MTDTMMLRDCIRSRGVKLGHVAHVLGISSGTLRCKLENEREFKLSEAEKLSKMLGMTTEQRDRCFFGPAGCDDTGAASEDKGGPRLLWAAELGLRPPKLGVEESH
jgi:hypothetical protein